MALQKYFGQIEKANDFDAIKVSIASPEQIRAWSFGEVKNPETINYRSLKPEKNGLFSAKIFGPIKDYECLCGKYKRIKYKGVICEKCGVEVTVQKVRRERMGHIELATPVAHIWFLKSLPSKISTLLDIPVKKLEKVLYFDSYIVIEPGLTPLKLNDLISEEEYILCQEQYGEEAFRVGIGAVALKEMLSQIDLAGERDTLREELIVTKSEITRKKVIKRLKIVEAFLESGAKPEWMVLDVLPVLPPELRPLVPLDGGRFASSDLNDLYRRVINRNNRLKRLMDLKAPEIIVRNEKRMLQEAVDSLFDNSRKATPVMANNKRALKSLSDQLKGKQGRFRQNLLGKRVDYSGRSVIVSGAELKLHECGLPKKMALELFKPFIFSKLESLGYANTIKSAKKLVEREEPVVWDILEDVIREHPVLLNRAPTLHRLGIQAFEPKLIEGKAIQLHPLVCAGFNADFDGDQIAVHVPLSLEAQLEARVLMMSTNNILLPASGKPIITPSQDMVLGLYYLTSQRDGAIGEGMNFSSLDEIRMALETGKVALHSKIKALHTNVDEQGNKVVKLYDTTVGRMLFSEIVPLHHEIEFDSYNKQLGKKDISKMVGVVYHKLGQKATVLFSDRLMKTGFKYSTKSGTSFGKSDLIIPAEKLSIVKATEAKIAEYEAQYQEGLITRQEKYNKVIDSWTECDSSVTKKLMERISQKEEGNFENSIFMMANSGARGSESQIKQLTGMRGLMAKPSGEIIETPILSNFKEGLSVSEFFNSTHGSRKGLADTALKTASAGYLTRRLVDVAQDSIIKMDDCGTERGIITTSIVNGGSVVEPLEERIVGRVAAEDVIIPNTTTIIVKRNELIHAVDVKKIVEAGIESVKIRSVLTCDAKEGICAKCYGKDLSNGNMVNVGEAVGVIAAQSIGEPGTQLTMRTFHVGGTAQRSVESSSIATAFNAKVSLRNIRTVKNSNGEEIVMSRSSEIVLTDSAGKELSKERIPYGSKLNVVDGQDVEKGFKLLEWNPYIKPIISEVSGKVQLVDLIDNISMKENVDESTGIASRIVMDWRAHTKKTDIKPQIALMDDKSEDLVKLPNGNAAKYIVSIGSIIIVNQGDKIQAGDIIAYTTVADSKTNDITGGLPRVEELFEARNPGNMAVIASENGIIEFKEDIRNKHKLSLQPENGGEPVEYAISKGTHINVQDGDFVRKGDKLTDGEVSLHDILRVLGVEELAKYLVQEVQRVYRLQGVEINDKHMECIIRQMLKKKEVVEPGATTFLTGEVVDVKSLIEENEKAIAVGGQPAKVKDVLLGITRASLQTNSFISSASFQETTKVFTEAAIAGKLDHLRALKENVVVGRLIPAGTGAYVNEMRALAKAKDKELDAKRSEVIESNEEEARESSLPGLL